MRHFLRTLAVMLLLSALVQSSITLAQPTSPACQEVQSQTHTDPTTCLTGSIDADQRWLVLGTAAGGNYILTAPTAPSYTGTPCCCQYLPMLWR